MAGYYYIKETCSPLAISKFTDNHYILVQTNILYIKNNFKSNFSFIESTNQGLEPNQEKPVIILLLQLYENLKLYLLKEPFTLFINSYIMLFNIII